MRSAPVSRIVPVLASALLMPAATSAIARDSGAFASDDKQDKPKLSLRASPAISFSPARVFLVAELKGGPNDYEEYYCPSIEWDWGDGTASEASDDCEPYQAGKSEIKRRYAVEHVFRTASAYQVHFRLKRKDRVLAIARTVVQVRPGIRDIGQ